MRKDNSTCWNNLGLGYLDEVLNFIPRQDTTHNPYELKGVKIIHGKIFQEKIREEGESLVALVSLISGSRKLWTPWFVVCPYSSMSSSALIEILCDQVLVVWGVGDRVVFGR